MMKPTNTTSNIAEPVNKSWYDKYKDLDEQLQRLFVINDKLDELEQHQPINPVKYAT